jgi:hypothetical protein
MGRLTSTERPDADVLGSADENGRLPARSQTGQAAWVSAVSYWCDYLTIIDLQGLDDPALRCAS